MRSKSSGKFETTPASDSKNDVCVDASLWIRFLCGEDPTDETNKIFDLLMERFNFFIAPSLLLFEVVSAIRRKQKIGKLTDVQAEKALVFLYEYPILLYQSHDYLTQTLRLSAQLGETVSYDASYLALATWRKTPFFTADRKFYEKAKGLSPDIQLV